MLIPFDATTDLGNAYYEQKRFDEALSVFNNSIRLEAWNLLNSYAESRKCLKLVRKNLRKLHEMYMKAMKLDSANHELYDKYD
ncbi:MAG: tetratricopeptide repeat protein [Ignavibacteria bacterium]|nr:tetratricopeptide repeat protein [Ignavibacteria bacterium]